MKHIITILALTATSALAQQVQVQEQSNRNRNVFRPENTNANVNAVENRVNTNVNNRVNNRVTNNNNSSATSSANANPNINVNGGNTFNPEVVTTVDYVAWKKWQFERKQYSRTKPGATVSKFDPRSSQVATPQVHADAKARYDAFLLSQGHNPKTLGHATLVNGKMVVPSAVEVYSR